MLLHVTSNNHRIPGTATVQNGHEGVADVPFGVSRTVVKNHGTKGDIKNHSSSSKFGKGFNLRRRNMPPRAQGRKQPGLWAQTMIRNEQVSE